jgi:voltage-gated potassium channel
MTERGSAIYQLTMLALSIYVLSILVIEAFFVSDPEIRLVLQYIDFFICLLFLLDFFINLYMAESRLAYMKWGWIDLLASIPMVDPLRWGRLARVVRILRFVRAIKSVKLLVQSIQRSKFESLTVIVIFVTFISFSVCSSLILEFEREYHSDIDTAQEALWWSFLNIMNAKVSLDQAQSTEGVFLTVVLNQVGLLLFAYFNAIIVAWLIQKRSEEKSTASN